MGQLLHVEKTSCCKPQPQTTLQKKTALYILSLQAYYDSTTIHFSVISSSECKQFWRNRTSWVCPGQYFYLLSVIHLIFLVIIFILLFFFLLCPLFLIVFPFSSLEYQNSDKTEPADVVRVPRDVHISYNIALILHLFSGFFFFSYSILLFVVFLCPVIWHLQKNQFKQYWQNGTRAVLLIIKREYLHSILGILWYEVLKN